MEQLLLEPVELTDIELDAVAGGAVAAAAGGSVAAAAAAGAALTVSFAGATFTLLGGAIGVGVGPGL